MRMWCCQRTRFAEALITCIISSNYPFNLIFLLIPPATNLIFMYNNKCYRIVTTAGAEQKRAIFQQTLYMFLYLPYYIILYPAWRNILFLFLFLFLLCSNNGSACDWPMDSDLYSIWNLDPDPYLEYGSRSLFGLRILIHNHQKGWILIRIKRMQIWNTACSGCLCWNGGKKFKKSAYNRCHFASAATTHYFVYLKALICNLPRSVKFCVQMIMYV
jgi:hypothetical protein